MNSKIERQTLTTRYRGGEGEGVCYVCFVGECQIQADVAHLTLLSSLKLIFFCEKGLFSGFPKETPELKFRLRLFLRSIANCSQVLNAHARRFE